MNCFDHSLSQAGIDYYIDKKDPTEGGCTSYWTRFLYFHESPLVKMTYHFVSRYEEFLTNKYRGI